MPENKFRVKGTDIQHNGKFYPEGSEIVLSDEDAKGLEAYLEKTEGDRGGDEVSPAPKGGKSK
jgi:hypothetical protein